ncbi:hypothetical protein Y88_1619 [Novosphingobium nitrogenifigens DSM 19370]|uniref:Uncharacterized protein n=1 Tax=Novosphingobium nitrogenifigens DSM 19370 TaxID=983920 RepID=F1ZCU8_9SPHN|nr:hypothetical protein Y88_1619 [Novosphingobium nitrogenifigens DSM 19370]
MRQGGGLHDRVSRAGVERPGSWRRFRLQGASPPWLSPFLWAFVSSRRVGR